MIYKDLLQAVLGCHEFVQGEKTRSGFQGILCLRRKKSKVAGIAQVLSLDQMERAMKKTSKHKETCPALRDIEP